LTPLSPTRAAVRLQAYLACCGVFEGTGGAHVMCEGIEPAVSGGAGDRHRVAALLCGGCRVSGAQCVSGDPGLGDSCDVGVVLPVDAGCCGAGPDDAGDRAARQCGIGDAGVVVDAGEQRASIPQLPAAGFEPRLECEDGASLGVGTEWDTDEVP